MWAQLIKARLKPGKDEDFQRLRDEIGAITEPDAGVVRATTMRDQKDPAMYYTLVVFESEAKARAREGDPRLQAVVSQMGALFEGPPDFADLEVVSEM